MVKFSMVTTIVNFYLSILLVGYYWLTTLDKFYQFTKLFQL